MRGLRVVGRTAGSGKANMPENSRSCGKEMWPVDEQLRAALVARITECLALGGLFNMEFMEAGKVRDLLIDCRTALVSEKPPATKAEIVSDSDYIHIEAAARRGLFAWREKPHNAKWWKKIDGTPIPNDLIVCIAQEISGSLAAERAAALAPATGFVTTLSEGIEQGRREGYAQGYACASADRVRELSPAQAEVEYFRKILMEHFHDKLSMDEIADCAYAMSERLKRRKRERP